MRRASSSVVSTARSQGLEVLTPRMVSATAVSATTILARLSWSRKAYSSLRISVLTGTATAPSLAAPQNVATNAGESSRASTTRCSMPSPSPAMTGTIRRLGDVGAGDRPAVMTEGRALAAPFSHVTVHEEGRGVEAHGAIVLHGPCHDTARRADARRRSTRRAANRGSRLDSPKPSPQRRNQCSYVISGRSRPQVGRGLAGARAGIVLAGVPPSTSTRVAWSVPVIPKYPSTVAAPPIGTDAGATGNPS